MKGGDCMRIEIRDDSVVIDGYVNAIERNSKLLRDKDGSFVEKVCSGAFDRAIKRANICNRDIKVLINHDYDKVVASTFDSTTKLWEDNIGLRCKCEVRDKDTIDKAKNNKLVGWSFGFVKLDDSWENHGDVRCRCLNDLELVEVSILDDSKIPAYAGTSIEARCQDDKFIEVRMVNDSCEVVDLSSGLDNSSLDDSNVFDDSVLDSFRNRILLTRCL